MIVRSLLVCLAVACLVGEGRCSGSNETATESDSRPPARKRVTCKRPMLDASRDEKMARAVELVDAAGLAEALAPEADAERDAPGRCALVLFYSRGCPFSRAAAPQFNALARLFPDLRLMGVDGSERSRANAQYGVVGVPTLVLFHNGRAAAKFNGSEYAARALVDFVRAATGIDEETESARARDFDGPVPSRPRDEADPALVAAWIFVAAVALRRLASTRLFAVALEAVESTWREAEAQHEHAQ